jgi:Mrp family chromosome partitioning ATPase
MRAKLLIASTDKDYTEHLSNRILEHHADAIDATICSSLELMRELLSAKKFDVALLEEVFIGDADLYAIHLPLLLWAEDENATDSKTDLKKIRKYQKVSSIVAEVLEKCAKVSADIHGLDPEKAQITAVWSPSGGVGKTSVALAYAAKKALEGKQVLYLNLEPFSSVQVYFSETGRSISTVFEMLENHDGNAGMLIRGIRQLDADTGIAYFCRPENFDDMNILSTENVAELINACAGVMEEVVVDMSCLCDERAQQVFEYADKAFIVTDASITAQTKLLQFTAQHHVFERIKDKAFLVANKGAVINNQLTDAIIMLPLVKSVDASTVYKTLSGCSFEM